MPKHYPVNKAPAEPDNVLPANRPEWPTAPAFWILKDATAKKLGKRSEGTISYRLLADADHQRLFLAITGNESNGYFSKERVPFQKVRECLSNFPDKPFPSKALRDAFFGRSSNNPCFLAAILSDLELIAADTTTESQHKAIGDWPAFEQAMLALPGTLLQADAAQALPENTAAMSDHTQTAPAEEVLSAKARKGSKLTKEADHEGDTPCE